MASSIPVSVPADAAAVPVADALGGAGARRTRRLVLAGGVVVLVLVIVAAAAPWIAPHDPVRQSLRARLAAPTLEAADGRSHLLGTDHLGRDVLSRMLWGARVSLMVGFAAVGVGGLVGAGLGIAAGYRGGWADTIIMTLADAQLAFPFILLAIGIIAVLGPSFPTLIVVIGLSGWMSYARVLRSHVLEATLSFLGLGVQPPTPSWGGMIQEGREYLDSAWWISTGPGALLMLTSLAVSRTGDWLRDLRDPTLRGE